MLGSEFIQQLSKFQITNYVGIEDFADKFNFLITVVMLLLCTTVVTYKQYITKPISCYLATEVGGKNLLDYVENYCWVQGTIPIAYADQIPQSDIAWADIENKKILYYQWVPFVLGLQSILFYMPHVIWQMICYNQSGTDIHPLILSANQAVHAAPEQREKLVSQVVRTLEQMLFQNQHLQSISYGRRIRSQASHPTDVSYITPPHYLAPNSEVNAKPPYPNGGSVQQLFNLPIHESATVYDRSDPITPDGVDVSWCGQCYDHFRRIVCCFRINHHRGTFLSMAYLFTKVLYLANALGQMFLMQHFLGFQHPGNITFGLDVLSSIIHGRDWKVTHIFPRVTFCYVPLRHFGTPKNTITAQCVLPVNMLNEKIYIFIWWWIWFVSVLTVLSLIRWSLRMVSRTRGREFVYKYLTLAQPTQKRDPVLLNRFTKSFLRRDGVFLFRMLVANAGELIAADILTELLNRYAKTCAISEASVANHEKDEQVDDILLTCLHPKKKMGNGYCSEPTAPAQDMEKIDRYPLLARSDYCGPPDLPTRNPVNRSRDVTRGDVDTTSKQSNEDQSAFRVSPV